MISLSDVRQKLREECRTAGSESAWAKANGISQSYVSDAIRGRRKPGKAILKALGLKHVRGYEAENGKTESTS